MPSPRPLTKRRLPGRLRQSLEAPAQLNHTWAVDFMSDALYGGRKIRTLNVIDEGNREALAIDVALSIPSVGPVELQELTGYPLLYLPIHIVWLETLIHPTAMLVFQELQKGTDPKAIIELLAKDPGAKPTEVDVIKYMM